MKLALISDIHGNLFAFDAVLEDIRQRKIEHILCMGDVVANGPQPHEALARLHKAKRFEDWDAMNENKQDKIAPTPLRSDPESKTATLQMSTILEQAIESLPEQYRTVVMLRDVEEMTTAETADCLSLTEDNVKIRLHRAHGMLRKELYARARISTAEAFPFHAPRCDRMVANVFAILAAIQACDGCDTH